jgi:hypothetical protein
MEGLDHEEEAMEPELPKTTTRVTRRARNKKASKANEDVGVDATPAATKAKAAAKVPRSRKLLSTASKQTPMRMLGVSNSAAAKRTGRRVGGALPTAEELGFKT